MANELRPVDADNHYYESLDAFTRHLDPKFKQRGVRAVRDGSHVEMIIAGKLNRFIPNPTFDPVIVPGCLDLQFRGQIPEGEVEVVPLFLAVARLGLQQAADLVTIEQAASAAALVQLALHAFGEARLSR